MVSGLLALCFRCTVPESVTMPWEVEADTDWLPLAHRAVERKHVRLNVSVRRRALLRRVCV